MKTAALKLAWLLDMLTLSFTRFKKIVTKKWRNL